MTSNAVGAESESRGLTGAERLRAEIERNHAPLLRRIGGLLLAADPGLGRIGALTRAEEVLSETVQRALERADHYDPACASVATWLMAIAMRVLAGQRRERARARRQVPGSTLGDGVWEQLLEGLGSDPPDDQAADRIDLREALGRLEPTAREAIEYRYFRGLDGDDLARALGAPTAGAARVRVCRALQALRDQFDQSERQVRP